MKIELKVEKVEDIKDGMIVEFRNGRKGICIGDIVVDFYEGGLVVESPSGDEKLNNIVALSSRRSFDSQCEKDWDIMKVSYDKKTLWERIEYVTFQEAVSKGELITNEKLCDVRTVGAILYQMSFLVDETIVDLVNSDKWVIVKHNKINENKKGE